MVARADHVETFATVGGRSMWPPPDYAVKPAKGPYQAGVALKPACR
jgi:hypothetical protein